MATRGTAVLSVCCLFPSFTAQWDQLHNHPCRRSFVELLFYACVKEERSKLKEGGELVIHQRRRVSCLFTVETDRGSRLGMAAVIMRQGSI